MLQISFGYKHYGYMHGMTVVSVLSMFIVSVPNK